MNNFWLLNPLIIEKSVVDVDRQVQGLLLLARVSYLNGKRSNLGYYFYESIVLVDVTNDMLVVHQEIFGSNRIHYKLSD